MKKVLYNNIIKKKNGRTMIETLSVILLLILLGAGCFKLFLSSFGAFQRLNDSKDISTELRVANSFIVNKVRQNDIFGSIDVKSEPINGNNALIIYEIINDENYATWIYHNSGYLMEALVLGDEEPSEDVSQRIAKIDDFKIDYDYNEQKLLISVGIEGSKPYNSTIRVRSK